MPHSIIAALAVASFVGIIVSAMGKLPLWIPCLFLSIIELLQFWPLSG